MDMSEQQTTTPKVTHLTTEELATRLRMHRNSVSNWRVEGKGPRFIKIGKLVLYPLTEIEAWEASHLVRSTVEKQ
jgi:predicted DNA-binding transcriptional regulator AlpA